MPSSPRPGADPRYRQADREALLSLGLYAAFFLWWTLFAFGLGGGNPAAYGMTFGMPNWFFYSCVAGYPLLTLLLWLVVRFGFSHMDLEAPAVVNETVAPATEPHDGATSPSADRNLP